MQNNRRLYMWPIAIATIIFKSLPPFRYKEMCSEQKLAVHEKGFGFGMVFPVLNQTVKDGTVSSCGFLVASSI